MIIVAAAEAVSELGISWTQTGLVVVTAAVVYAATIALSRLFGQRQFATSSTYDLAFVFAIGSVVGRVILVRTSLLASLIGLLTLFLLHAGTGWLHHRSELAHRLLENRSILLVAHGNVLDDNLRRAHVSHAELLEELRLAGHGSLDEVAAATLERNGTISVVSADTPLDPALFDRVVGAEHLRASPTRDR